MEPHNDKMIQVEPSIQKKMLIYYSGCSKQLDSVDNGEVGQGLQRLPWGP